MIKSGSMSSPLFNIPLAMVVFGLSIGCGDSGPELAIVTGKVTQGGKPLSSVSVTFTAADGTHSSAGISNSEGVFFLETSTGKPGAVLGKHKATLAVASAGSSSGSVDYGAMAKARQANTEKRGAPKKDGGPKAFPPEYADPAKTPLEFEVKAGSNQFDIVIP